MQTVKRFESGTFSSDAAAAMGTRLNTDFVPFSDALEDANVELEQKWDFI